MEIVAIVLAKGDQISLQLFIFLFGRRLARRLQGRWRNLILVTETPFIPLASWEACLSLGHHKHEAESRTTPIC